MRRFIVFLAILIVADATGCSLWPKPNDMSAGTTSVAIDSSSFTFKIVSGSTPILERAIDRYRGLIFYSYPHAWKSGEFSVMEASITSISISVADTSAQLQLGVDESYELSISSDNATLVAQTVFGAMKGLETLSQLVEYVSDGHYSVPCTPLTIKDAPIFPHRGLLIDTSRHYLPLPLILNSIDALSFVKMNTLHWHIVDSQSFPMIPSKYPDLAKAAWWPGHTVYSLSDIHQVVEYAQDRGVRVVLEIDIPGHTDSWGVGLPDIRLTDCVLINPVSNYTYDVIDSLLKDVASDTLDAIVHLGGDEVSYDCWKASPEIQEWMKQHGTTNPTDVYQQFANVIHGLSAHTITHWQEVFNLGVDVSKDTIFHVWKDAKTLQSVVKAGYRGLFSFGWYLDHLGDTWETFYANPMYDNFTDEEDAKVIGGEACMWGEKCDLNDFSSRVWPRTAAVGERLWTKESAPINEASERINEHRCRMVRRGVPSSPIAPGFCAWSF